MKCPLLFLLPWLYLLLPFSLLRAEANIQARVRSDLAAGHFDDLEKLYRQVSAQPFDISEEWPDLSDFFAGVTDGLQAQDDDPPWAKRHLQIDAWLTALPDSIPARLALADFLEEYAWQGRGTGYAKTVTQKGWALFAERRHEAEAVLAAGPDALRKAIYYDYILAYILAPDESRFAEAREHLAALNRRAPGFYPAYSLHAFFLLPRWHGEPGDYTQYAGEVSDRLGGQKGDMLYASLLGEAAYEDEDRFPATHQPDYPRMVRGFDALIAHPDDRFQRIAAYSYASGLMGDWKRTRMLLLKLGPVAGSSYKPWNGKKNYDAFLARSGARNDIVAAEMLEGSGRLAGAEAVYRAFDPDPATNRWLGGFYLRHGDEARFAASAGAPDLAIPADKVSLDEAGDRCLIFGALRDFKRGAPFAQRFDRVRGHNFRGKTFFYEAALFTGDKAAAQKAREAIIGRKTNRKSYQLAQRMLADGADTDSFRPDDFDWDDLYSRQGAVIVALRLYELGKPAMARRLLQAAWDTSTYQFDSDHILSLLYNPPPAPKEPSPLS